jgi:hypothetical protein
MNQIKSNRLKTWFLAFIKTLSFAALCWGASGSGGAELHQSASPPANLRVSRFLTEPPISRAKRVTTISAQFQNAGANSIAFRAQLILPKGVRMVRSESDHLVRLAAGEQQKLSWNLEANAAMDCELGLQAKADGATVATSSLTMEFLPLVRRKKSAYIPEPQPAPTPILVGAHNCPLWVTNQPQLWANVIKHPERTPALGLYTQENPEVADWETKWAVEHGISFFIYCWYRTEQGGAVKTRFGSAIHDGLFKSRFADKMKFTLMWENQAKGIGGVSDEHDLMTNLLPYWIENYFKNPGYVKIDNKPLLFIYRPEFLVQDLGGESNVARAFDLMRAACRKAGFDGLYLLGEYRGLERDHLQLMKRLGLDYTFAYCWYVPDSPTPEQAIKAQLADIEKTRDMGILPEVVTASQAWSGWSDEGTIWKIPPPDYETLLRKVKEVVTQMPANTLSSKLVLLDNWNEWGEGHYIAPYREYGFGYLDAVRKVFSRAPEPHTDLIPEDIGMGPYDGAYRVWERQQARKTKAN